MAVLVLAELRHEPGPPAELQRHQNPILLAVHFLDAIARALLQKNPQINLYSFQLQTLQEVFFSCTMECILILL